MWSPDGYGEALRFAAERHGEQRMPGTGWPYVVHLTAVAAEVMAALTREPFAAPDLAVQCALLHDTVEDTATTAAEVAARFGAAVAAGVVALSKDAAVAKADRLADSLRRIRQQPPEVWIVKLADRVVNLERPPAPWTGDKRRAYRAEAGEILAALAAASPFLADRLRGRIARYADYLEP